MINIGLMTVRNERDVLADSYLHLAHLFDKIVVQDGSTDGGREMVTAWRNVVHVIGDEEVLQPGERFCDAHRNAGLQWIMEHYGAEGVWVTLLHPDEFWWDNPVQIATQAESDGASYVLWGEFRFFMHTTDEGTLDLTLPVTQRLSWYCGPFFEVRQFCLEHHQVYVPGRDHCTLPSGPGTAVRWPYIPRYRHYPYRSPTQTANAYWDKIGMRYWQPDHEWLKSGQPFIDCLPEPTNSPLARWDRVEQFNGTLPDPAQFLPDWWEG